MVTDKFIYTQEQQQVVDEILEKIKQLKAGEKPKNMLISGRGGTGKSSMACNLIVDLVEQDIKIAAGAFSGKATGVLRRKIKDTLEARGLPDFPEDRLMVETLHTIMKKAYPIGIDAEGKTRFISKWRAPQDFNYDILFLDEMSMVNQVFAKAWQQYDCLVIGLGDEKQIPPVETAEIYKEVEDVKRDLQLGSFSYKTQYGVKALQQLSGIQLTEVLRNVGDITKMCNELRDFTLSSAQMTAIMKKYAAQSDEIEYKTSLDDIENGTDWQIICYTNKTAEMLNNKLMGHVSYPRLSDKILLCDNINPIGMYNGEVFVFQDFLEKIENYNLGLKNEKIYVCMKWMGRMPKSSSPNPIEKMFASNYAAFQDRIKRVNTMRIKELTEKLRGTTFANLISGIEADIKELRNAGKNDQQIFDTITLALEASNYPAADYLYQNCTKQPRIYVVSAQGGYAITIHKSQGSQFEKTCFVHEKWDKPLVYTACSRAVSKLKIINLTNTR